MDYLEPFPNDPPCPICKKPVSVTPFERARNVLVMHHRDGSAPCESAELPTARRNADGSITFSFEPILFAELAVADQHFARRISLGAEDGPIRYGYVVARGVTFDRRLIGRVKQGEPALRIAERGPEGTVTVRDA